MPRTVESLPLELTPPDDEDRAIQLKAPEQAILKSRINSKAQLHNAACFVFVLIQEPRLSLTDPVMEVMMVLRGVNSSGRGAILMMLRG